MAIAAAAPAGAVSITSTQLDGPDLGAVALGTTTSVLRIDPDSGGVTTLSGDALRLQSAPCTPPVITVSCAANECRDSVVTASFTPTGGGRASISGFLPGQVSSKGLQLTAVVGAGTSHLTMTFVAPQGGPATATFPLGMIVTLGAAGAPGRSEYGYALTVSRN